MSLFAGTSFLTGSSKKNDAAQDNVEDGPGSASSVQQQASESVKGAPASSSSANGKSATTIGWSPALRFAPAASRKANKPTNAFTPRTSLPAGFSTTTSVNTSGSSSTTPPLTKAPHEVVVSAAPQLYNAIPAQSASTSAPPIDTNGKKIFKPPALTLAPGEVKEEPPVGKKRAAPTGGERGGKKRRRGKKRGPLYTQPIHQFDPFEDYDPAKPNDLQEWRDYRQARRAEKKEEDEEERRQRDRAGESGSGSDASWEEEDEEEEVDRRPAPKGFAPPPMLYAPPPHSTGMAFRPIYPDEDDERPPPQQYPVSVPVPIAQSAEEAYQRRVAMSQMASKPPSFAPPTFTSAIRPPAFNPAPAFIAPIEEPAAAPPPLIPGSEEFERRKAEALEQVKARMAAIEAMKPTMGVGGTSSGTTDQSEKEDDHGAGGSIAARLMRKMGYEEGKGLGVDGSGIKHALSAEHSNPVVNKNTGKPGRWTQAKNAQGKLVNLNENEKERADRERYGEPSRIVCLSNVVARPEEVDDDLSKEMGEECNNYGIVERVAIHYVQPPPSNPAEIVRIFIVFSGLAGAWKCVKELDRRFFGGLELRATYFDEKRFHTGQKDGPLL